MAMLFPIKWNELALPGGSVPESVRDGVIRLPLDLAARQTRQELADD